MVVLHLPLHRLDLPFTLRIPNVTEEMFDRLVNEDTRAELIDGVMVVPSPASPRHDAISNLLRFLLTGFASMHKAGRVFGSDVLVHLATCRKFAPDAFFLRADQVPVPLPEKEFALTPALVLEVLSPSNRDEDLEDKRPAYQEAGVSEIWIVDPDEQQVLVDVRKRKRYSTTTTDRGRLTSTVLPGFWIEAEWLWADPLPNEMECLQAILDSQQE